MTLKNLFESIHESLEHSSADEIKAACELIIIAQELNGGEIDTLLAAHEHGPLDAGDLPSKAARDRLVQLGLMTQIVVKGEEGFNAVTYRGRSVYRLVQAMGLPFDFIKIASKMGWVLSDDPAEWTLGVRPTPVEQAKLFLIRQANIMALRPKAN